MMKKYYDIKSIHIFAKKIYFLSLPVRHTNQSRGTDPWDVKNEDLVPHRVIRYPLMKTRLYPDEVVSSPRRLAGNGVSRLIRDVS